MRADFSRWSFDILKNYEKHYAGVLHQQGRVWLDADWNEEVLSRLFLLQQESQDIIGVCGTPADPGTAFEISLNEKDPMDFLIAGGPEEKGHYFVHGILAQLEQSTSFLNQPDLPGLPDSLLPFSPDHLNLGEVRCSIVYLEVWRRLITYLEDVSLREVALGGPDTATRFKTIAQVKAALIPSDQHAPSCETAELPGSGLGTLTTLQPKDAPPPDLCRLPDPANYTGRENRLYRVEIHDAGDVLGGTRFTPRTILAVDSAIGATTLALARPLTADERKALTLSGIVTVSDDDGQSETVPLSSVALDGKTLTLGSGLKTAFTINKNAAVSWLARFKWSRDNAAFAVGVTDVSVDRATLTLTSLGRDQATALRAGDLVEISDDASELGPNRGHLTTLSAEPDPDQFTASLSDSLPDNFQVAGHLVLRRWDGVGWARAAFNDTATPDMNLGEGVHIEFGGYDLRPGDYWQFATRSADGSVEPLIEAEPMGIRRYRCPLAVVRWTKEHDWDKEAILQILSKNQILAHEQLETVRKELEVHPDRRLVKASIVDLAKSNGATNEKLGPLEAALTQSKPQQPINLHFFVDHDCRKKFPPLTAIEHPWPYLKYVGGDGQESEPDGTLGQALQVAVYKGSIPLSNATVQFRITKGLGGTLNGGAQQDTGIDRQ